MSGASLDAPSAFALRRPGAAAAIALAVLGAAGLGVLRLRPVTDVTQIVRTPSAAALGVVSARFGLNEQAVIMIEADRPGAGEALLATADALERRLMASGAFTRVAHGLPLSIDDIFERLVLPHGILYLDPARPADAAALEELLTPEGLRARLEKSAGSLDMPGLGQIDAFVARDPLELHRPVIARLRSLKGSFEVSPDSAAFLSEDGRAILLTAVAREPASRASAARAVVSAVRASWAGTQEELAAARAMTLHATGAHFLAEESERIISTDLTLSLSTSIAVAALLLALGLRLRPWAVPLLCLPTLWGCAVGVGLFVAVRPELAILSLGCSAILVGLGIDFTIHLTAAALERRAAGRAPDDAALEAVRGTRGALALATLTSMAAFGAFVTSEQGFLADMGMLTCLGLVSCLAGALFVLPPVLARVSGGELGGWRARTLGGAGIARAAEARPAAVLLAAAALSAGAAVALAWRPIGFEDDLRDIHARGSPVLAAQRRVAEVFGGSREPLLVLVRAPVADDAEAAVVAACQRLEEPIGALIADGTLRARSSVAAFLPPVAAQRRCIERLAAVDPAATAAALRAALDEVGFDPAAFEGYVAAFERALAQREPLDLRRAREAGLDALVGRFVSPPNASRVPEEASDEPQTAVALLALYPTEDLWNAARRERVVGAVRAALARADVDGAVTGLYVVSSESARQVAADFRRVSLLTVAGVVLVMALRFRRPRHVLLVLLPASLGALWTAGALTLGGYELNLMNLGVLPMVLAIGIDDGIHVLHRRLAEREGGAAAEAAFAATIAAVVLTSLTTMVTFGSLGLSRNQGIASVGVLSFVGVGACLLASVAVLPAAMRVLGVGSSRD